MTRLAQTLFIIVAFAIPAALGVMMFWPYLLHRSVPTELNGDALGILAIALLVGVLVAIMVAPRRRRA